MLTKKDLIAINQRFSNGNIVNNSSLDFILAQTHPSRDWYKTMCIIVRSIILDQIFEDGNKRTATAIIMTYFDIHGHSYNDDRVIQVVLRITKHNIKEINKIERLLNYATK